MQQNIKRGFTLIELLVVIAIIGLLASVVIASLSSARSKGRDARRIADLKSIQLAEELYFDATSGYTATTTALASTYIATVPKDPGTGSSYVVAGLDTDSVGATCEKYHAMAQLEVNTNNALTNDADASAGTACTGSVPDITGNGAVCGVAGGTDACYDLKP